ncbi:MAG: translation initiation factor IF-2 [Alphaproteobacteria bacterium]|nr:MAG: translation initiation factor IF-2 [Alphaproteobacteria bacterium]
MADQNDDKGAAKPTLTMAKPNKLSLTKTVESGKVTQNFTHGRSKQVTVEVRKTRTFSRKPGEEGAGDAGTTKKETGNTSPFGNAPFKVDLNDFAVRDKRQIEKAATELRSPEEERRRQEESYEEVAPVVAPVEEEPVAAPAPVGEPIVRPVQSKKINPIAITPPARPAETPKRPAKAADATPNRDTATKNNGRVATANDDADAAAKKKMKLKGTEDNRRFSGKMSVSDALDYQGERMRSLASIKRQREKARREADMGGAKDKVYREVTLPEHITVQDLANRMSERVTDVIKSLMKMGVIASASQSIDADTAEIVVEELGHKAKRVTDADVENILIEDHDAPELLRARPPVVTIMGHVDHGKTSLLDALRQTSVAAGESGGITQHIGAYQVEAHGQKVTFLDTPGHEAFTAMRSRGAKSTDIVVLVVAADDGVMTQTQEAINHARAADVPIIVAINKMDKPSADPARVKNELLQYEIVAEEFGGQVPMVEVSAKTKIGLETLIETILVQAEIMELKANPNRNAAGVVIEAQIDKTRGTTTTLLVQKGTLNIGDIIVAGSSWGKVRALSDDKGIRLVTATPSQPIEVLGLAEPPMAGDVFAVVESEKTARDITEYRAKRERDRHTIATAKTLDQLFSEAGAGQIKELNVIVKGDVQGSVEAIIGSLQKFVSNEVKVKIVHSAVGAVNESDVSLAYATGAIIIGFNVRAVGGAKALAERERIDIRYYSVIYDLVDDVRDALSGLLSPERREEMIGYAEIRDVFVITKVGKVAGCYVTDGEVRRGAGVRLLRDNVVIHEGKLKTLKRFKDEMREVRQGYECGMAFENYDDIKVGDMIEAYEIKEIARRVEG